MFEVDEASSKRKATKHKHCPFVEVKHNGRTLFINKTTAVWLLQEGERVSSDRLFRVRSRQPYSSDRSPQPQIHCTSNTHPAVRQSLEVGNICVFSDTKCTWKIGRVLQFSYHLGRTKSAQQYCGTTATLTDKTKKIGVLCAWYTLSSPTKFTMAHCDEAHAFVPITSYICTLSHGCFEKIESANINNSIMSTDPTEVNLATAQHLTLSSNSLSYIRNLLDTADASPALQSTAAITIVGDSGTQSFPSESKEYWTKCGGIVLNNKALQQIVNGKELSDLHVNAYQNLLKQQFPHIGGLQNTLLQKRSPLQPCGSSGMSLQIIHVRNSHWAALQLSGNDVCLYDVPGWKGPRD